MKATNFLIKDSIHLEYLDSLYDLHNDYDFVGFVENKIERTVVLDWKKTVCERDANKHLSSLQVVINGIREFKVDPGRDNASPLDKVTLEEIVYVSDDEWCDGPFTTFGKVEESWDWIFIFESDQWLIIDAESATVYVQV